MSMFAVVLSIIALVFVFSVRGRVVELENSLKELKNSNLKESKETAGVNSSSASVSGVDANIDGSKAELFLYIKNQLVSGTSERDILQTLLGNGWDEASVNSAISDVKETLVSSPDAYGEKLSVKKDTPSFGNGFMEWMLEDWLMKIGAFLLLVGFGWFVNFAFKENWIGPIGRITLGLVFGVSILLLGEWRIRGFKNQGAVLLALGTAVIIATTIAGREVYGFFSGFTALAMSFLSIAFIAASSVRHNSKALATLAVILGSTIHFFVLDQYIIDDVVWRFSYLLVVSVGSLWVVALTGWKFLVPTSLFLVTFFNSNSFFYPTATEKDTMLFISFLFVALYFAANLTGILKSDKVSKFDMITAAGVGAFSMVWILATAPSELQSILTAITALVFAVASFVVFQATGKYKPALLYSGIATAMLGAATAMELDGAVLTLAYIFEVGILVVVGAFVLNSMSISQKIGTLFILPVFLSFGSMGSSAWVNGVLHKDFFVLLLLSLVLLVLGYFFHINKDVENPPSKEWTMSYVVFGAVYSLVLVWLSSHALIDNPDTATMVALVIYTIVGLILYIRGRVNEVDSLRVFGAFLLAIVIFRMLFVEVWNMALEGRIITFVLIGVLLISTAFIGRKKEETLINTNSEL